MLASLNSSHGVGDHSTLGYVDRRLQLYETLESAKVALLAEQQWLQTGSPRRTRFTTPGLVELGYPMATHGQAGVQWYNILGPTNRLLAMEPVVKAAEQTQARLDELGGSVLRRYEQGEFGGSCWRGVSLPDLWAALGQFGIMTIPRVPSGGSAHRVEHGQQTAMIYAYYKSQENGDASALQPMWRWAEELDQFALARGGQLKRWKFILQLTSTTERAGAGEGEQAPQWEPAGTAHSDRQAPNFQLRIVARVWGGDRGCGAYGLLFDYIPDPQAAPTDEHHPALWVNLEQTPSYASSDLFARLLRHRVFVKGEDCLALVFDLEFDTAQQRASFLKAYETERLPGCSTSERGAQARMELPKPVPVVARSGCPRWLMSDPSGLGAHWYGNSGARGPRKRQCSTPTATPTKRRRRK